MVDATRADVVQMVSERVGERGTLGGLGRFVAGAIESRERVRVRIDHLGGGGFELRHLVRERTHAGPRVVGDPVRSVGPIVHHSSKDRLVQ